MSTPHKADGGGGDANVSSHHGVPEAQKQDLKHENIDNVAAEGVSY